MLVTHCHAKDGSNHAVWMWEINIRLDVIQEVDTGPVWVSQT